MFGINLFIFKRKNITTCITTAVFRLLWLLCFQPEKPNRRKYPLGRARIDFALCPLLTPIAGAFNRAKNATEERETASHLKRPSENPVARFQTASNAVLDSKFFQVLPANLPRRLRTVPHHDRRPIVFEY